ncbi:MAG: 3-dehydroquinate synthase [Burkholderiaceae bacterium]
MQDIVVDLGERGYPIEVGFDLLARNRRLRDLAAGRAVCVISDEIVGPLHAGPLIAGLGDAPALISRLDIPAGEGSKCWAMLDRICAHLLEQRFDRKSLLVALGGGVVGDLVGFAAAIYQRGIDFVQVPTTLLAQVDSSVGGKTAINHALGKNMVGAFHQPRLVIADVGTLATLPSRELVAGLAEVIKHGAIADTTYLAGVEQALDRLLGGDADALATIVAGSIRIKAAVVAADERESNLRAILNFGHTFGHAIEAGLGYGEWLHGEAVGCGMVMAADLSVRLGLLEPGDCKRLTELIAAAGLPSRGPGWPPSRYLALMETDKKAERGTPRFVVLERLGRARMRAVPAAVVAETLLANGAAAETLMANGTTVG